MLLNRMIDFYLNVVFNIICFFKRTAQMTDKQLIERLGGVSAVAKIIGCSPQRVSNWVKRGIPPKVKIEHPKLFLPHLNHD
nr:MAG TPA: Putative antitoxin of bacterial toxin-antitoxin system, YdaS/YdaT [Caudoviricetes sp.]